MHRLISEKFQKAVHLFAVLIAIASGSETILYAEETASTVAKPCHYHYGIHLLGTKDHPATVKNLCEFCNQYCSSQSQGAGLLYGWGEYPIVSYRGLFSGLNYFYPNGGNPAINRISNSSNYKYEMLKGHETDIIDSVQDPHFARAFNIWFVNPKKPREIDIYNYICEQIKERSVIPVLPDTIPTAEVRKEAAEISAFERYPEDSFTRADKLVDNVLSQLHEEGDKFGITVLNPTIPSSTIVDPNLGIVPEGPNYLSYLYIAVERDDNGKLGVRACFWRYPFSELRESDEIMYEIPDPNDIILVNSGGALILKT